MKKIKPAVLNQVTTHFLRAVIYTISIIVLLICVFIFPLMWREIPREYPNHTYVFYGIISAFYIAAVPFYIALYQAHKLLGLIDINKAFSHTSTISLRTIAYCGIVIGVIFSAVMPLIYIWADNDDAPGLILVWTALMGASFTVAVFAEVMQRVLKQAIAIQSENELTV